MSRLSDEAIDIVNELHTERLDYNLEYLPLIKALNRLQELEDLEKAGRLMELPCKAGDTVYEISKGKAKRFNVTLIEICDGNIYLVHSHGGQTEILNACKIGKTVFLTPEETKAALEGAG